LDLGDEEGFSPPEDVSRDALCERELALYNGLRFEANGRFNGERVLVSQEDDAEGRGKESRSVFCNALEHFLERRG